MVRGNSPYDSVHLTRSGLGDVHRAEKREKTRGEDKAAPLCSSRAYGRIPRIWQKLAGCINWMSSRIHAIRAYCPLAAKTSRLTSTRICVRIAIMSSAKLPMMTARSRRCSALCLRHRHFRGDHGSVSQLLLRDLGGYTDIVQLQGRSELAATA